MKTQQQSLLEFLGTPEVRFTIPVYQRVYSWNDAQCNDLWRDTLRAGRLGTEHFVGTVLYSIEEKPSESRQFDIIDGQQRMATLTIMLTAFADYLREHADGEAAINAEDIVQTYLRVAEGDASSPKLTLARADRETFSALICGGDMPDEPSERVVENYRLFKGCMDAADFDPDVFWRGVGLLLAIVAELDEDDSPQLVFESLNSKGMPLTTGDLIRNSLLVGVSHKDQTRLYREFWEPIENAIGDDPDGVKLNAAVHGWLAIRFPRAHIHDAGEVYDVFKSYIIDVYDGPLEDLLDELRGFCEMFGETIKANPDKKITAADWAKGKSRTRSGSFDELKGPAVAPLKRDLGSSRRTFT